MSELGVPRGGAHRLVLRTVWNTYQLLMPFGVASSEVCGENTEMPLALSFRRDDCSGSSIVMLFRPRKICRQLRDQVSSPEGGS